MSENFSENITIKSLLSFAEMENLLKKADSNYRHAAYFKPTVDDFLEAVKRYQSGGPNLKLGLVS
jgi:hypothetical protein